MAKMSKNSKKTFFGWKDIQCCGQNWRTTQKFKYSPCSACICHMLCVTWNMSHVKFHLLYFFLCEKNSKLNNCVSAFLKLYHIHWTNHSPDDILNIKPLNSVKPNKYLQFVTNWKLHHPTVVNVQYPKNDNTLRVQVTLTLLVLTIIHRINFKNCLRRRTIYIYISIYIYLYFFKI